jgi:hypothetical protein
MWQAPQEKGPKKEAIEWRRLLWRRRIGATRRLVVPARKLTLKTRTQPLGEKTWGVKKLLGGPIKGCSPVDWAPVWACSFSRFFLPCIYVHIYM